MNYCQVWFNGIYHVPWDCTSCLFRPLTSTMTSEINLLSCVRYIVRKFTELVWLPSFPPLFLTQDIYAYRNTDYRATFSTAHHYLLRLTIIYLFEIIELLAAFRLRAWYVYFVPYTPMRLCDHHRVALTIFDTYGFNLLGTSNTRQ